MKVTTNIIVMATGMMFIALQASAYTDEQSTQIFLEITPYAHIVKGVKKYYDIKKDALITRYASIKGPLTKLGDIIDGLEGLVTSDFMGSEDFNNLFDAQYRFTEDVKKPLDRAVSGSLLGRSKINDDDKEIIRSVVDRTNKLLNKFAEIIRKHRYSTIIYSKQG